MQKFGEVLRELAKKNLFIKNLYVSTLSREHFEDVIGKPFNEHCKVVMFKDGVIYIECDDQLFVTELNFFREKIREKLNDRLGIYAIKKVVIRKKRRAINGL